MGRKKSEARSREIWASATVGHVDGAPRSSFAVSPTRVAGDMGRTDERDLSIEALRIFTEPPFRTTSLLGYMHEGPVVVKMVPVCVQRGPVCAHPHAGTRSVHTLTCRVEETRAADLAFALHIYDTALGMVTRNTTLARA